MAAESPESELISRARQAKKVIEDPVRHGPSMVMLGGGVINRLLETNQYDPKELYLIDREGHVYVVPPE